MSFQPSNSYAPFLPTTVVLPSEEVARNVRITQIFNDMALRLNNREIATYELVELLNGQAWFGPNVNKKRLAFRKVFTIPALTGSGTVSIPHNLGNISGFTFTRIYGTAKNSAGTLFIPLVQSAPDDVSITVDSTNINVTCATGTYNGFSAIIVLEYVKS